jgi:hypothetical protein
MNEVEINAMSDEEITEKLTDVMTNITMEFSSLPKQRREEFIVLTADILAPHMSEEIFKDAVDVLARTMSDEAAEEFKKGMLAELAKKRN